MSEVDSLMKMQLPMGWSWKTMGEIAEVVSGGTPKTSDPTNFEGGDISWLTPADLSGYSSKFVSHGARYLTAKGLQSCSAKLIPAGALLFTSRAPIGYVAIASNPISTNQGFKNFVLRDDVLPEYVYWWLKGAKKLAESLASGTTFLEISGTNAKKIPIPIAPIETQRKIVAEIEKQFSRLDEAAANLQRVKANLKRYKASVLKAAVEGRLVETEASIAQREGRSYETGEQLLLRILEERHMKWTGRGKYKGPESPRIQHTFPLPDGWTWATLGHLSLSVKDGPHYSPKYATEGIPFISGGNVRPEGIDFTSSKYITRELHEELSKRCKPEVGDLLYTKGGTTGIARVNTDPRDFNVWVHVAVIKLADPLHSFYVQHALNSQHCYCQAQEYTHGVGNQDLGLTRMVWITVPLPPLAEQTRIVSEIDRHFSIIHGVEIEVETNLKRTRALRQATLMKAFSAGVANG